MSIETLQTASTISYIAAGILLLVAVALFFLLDIKKVIGDLTGITAKRAIENIRQQNEQTGEKNYKSSSVNLARGKLTDKISQSGKLIKNTSGIGISPHTEKFSTTELNPDNGQTAILNDSVSETTVLSNPENETTVLNKEFSVEVEMGFAESSERQKKSQRTGSCVVSCFIDGCFNNTI